MSYYIRIRGQESGPFSAEQIRDFLLAVRIGPKTPCRTEGESGVRTVRAVLPEVVADVERLRQKGAAPSRSEREERRNEKIKNIIVTTEAAPLGLQIDQRVGIVTAEVVFGVNVFKELFASVRNVVGGRSESLQSVLRNAREAVLEEMRREAFQRGADAVIGVSLNYNDITTGGSTMLFLVGAGTAVKLARAPESDDGV